MIPCPIRIANRYLLGDLNPPLGGSDSPCDLLHRINDEVGNPKDKNKLIRLVENGTDLTNPQAHIVYDDISEKGIGKLRFKNIDITAHAQYRMDLRGVSVQEIRSALYAFQKKIQVDKAQRGWSRLEDYLGNDTVSYTAPNKLKVVFQPYLDGRGRDPIDKVTGCKIITVYFEGVANPKPPSESECQIRKAFKFSKVDSLKEKTNKLLKEMKKKNINTTYLSKDLMQLVTNINRSFPEDIPKQRAEAFRLVGEYNAIRTKEQHRKWLKKSIVFFDKVFVNLEGIESRKVFEHTEMLQGIVVTYHFNPSQLGLLTRIKTNLKGTLKLVKKRTPSTTPMPSQIIVDLLDKRDVEGYYLRQSNFITITLSTAKKKNVPWAICHEIGHFIYDNFSKKQQKLWDSFIENNTRSVAVDFLMQELMKRGLDNLTEYGVLADLKKTDPDFYDKVLTIKELNKEFKSGEYSFTWESLDEMLDEGISELQNLAETITPYASVSEEEFFSEFFAQAITEGPLSLSPRLQQVWSTLL